VAGCCEYGDEPSCSAAMELVSFFLLFLCLLIQTHKTQPVCFFQKESAQRYKQIRSHENVEHNTVAATDNSAYHLNYILPSNKKEGKTK
jgi:hypothetical protein